MRNSKPALDLWYILTLNISQLSNTYFFLFFRWLEFFKPPCIFSLHLFYLLILLILVRKSLTSLYTRYRKNNYVFKNNSDADFLKCVLKQFDFNLKNYNCLVILVRHIYLFMLLCGQFSDSVTKCAINQ